MLIKKHFSSLLTIDMKTFCSTITIIGISIIFKAQLIQTSALNENNHATDAPTVSTAIGKIQGTILKSLYGQDIYAYLGIPYAKAPINDLRFKAPQPIEAWNDTLKATKDSLVCPQAGVLQMLMSEDCLKLNVFTRNLRTKYPVIVYIHGGANVLGSGHSVYEAGPQYLLEHDIVLVAFNYRLGALGFLSTKTFDYPGNYGYLDQVMLLKWVQRHIENFGGDPNRVTIFGLSAGSMAVTLHLASPLSKGLFHHAIAMSGSASNHFHIDNLYWSRKLAKELSCPQYHPDDMVKCLREISWQKIVNKCSEWEPYKLTNMKWNYEIDDIFLKQHPTQAFAEGNFNKVPLMVGLTRNELDFSVQHQKNNTGLLHDLFVSFESYAPEIFLYEQEHGNTKSLLLKQFYLNDLTEFNSSNLYRLGEMFSDAIIGHGIYRLVQLTYKHQPVYYYCMDYKVKRSLYNDENGQPRGVGHADDLQYIMPGLWYGPQLSVNDSDIFMVRRMTQLWATFARDGIPYANDVLKWPALEDSTFLTLYNDKETYLAKPPFSQHYQLWDELFPITKNAGAYFSDHRSLQIVFTLCYTTITLWL